MTGMKREKMFENLSGIKPVNQNVLIRPEEVEEKIGSVYLPDAVQDRNQHAQTWGVIVSLCDDAFEEMTERPVPGTKVCFARYGGAIIDGMDGEKYRLLKDIDVTGVAA